MSDRDIERLDAGAAAQHGADGFLLRALAVQKRHPFTLFGAGLVVAADKPRLGHADGRQIEQHAEMAGQAEASGMGDALAIAKQEIRKDGQLIDSRQEHRRLAEREQPWHVRESGGLADDAGLEGLEGGEIQYHHRRPGNVTPIFETHVGTGDTADSGETVAALYAASQAFLKFSGFSGCLGPGMAVDHGNDFSRANASIRCLNSPKTLIMAPGPATEAQLGASETAAMQKNVLRFLKLTVDSARDLAPIIVVIGFFQIAVLQQPIPNLGEIVVGVLLVLLGLTLFIQGLEMGLFPVGEGMADAFAHKGSPFWLLAFAFALCFGTTAAEPALIAVAAEAATVAAAAGVVGDDQAAQDTYAFCLRFTVAISVGIALVVGVFRILKGWPVHYLIIGGYVCVVVMTFFAPTEIIGIAYDSGGVTTSTITVPLVTALGVGLAQTIRGRNPMIDGFGLIAFASLTPMIFVMAFGMIWNLVG